MWSWSVKTKKFLNTFMQLHEFLFQISQKQILSLENLDNLHLVNER